MKKPIVGFLIALIGIIIPVGILATSSWQNDIQFTVSDNTGVARTGVPILTGINGQALIDSLYINSNGTNTNIQEAGTNSVYGIATGNVTLFIPSLPANSTRTYDLYTGWSPVQTDFSIIVGNNGYITTVDNALLELSDNFTVTQDIWIGSEADGVASANKTGAFLVLIYSSTGNVTAIATTSSGNVTLSTSGLAAGIHRVKINVEKR